MDSDSNKSVEAGWPARYQIKTELRKGVLGRLFLAHDQEQGKDVLIKIASPWLSEDRGFKAYIYDRWAEKETLFEHPNIADIIEVGKRTGCYFLVAEYPGDYTLEDELQKAPLDNERAIELLYQIAEALRAAHRRHVACGHLKPADIHISTDPAGRVAVKVMFVDMGVDAQNAAGSLIGETYGAPKYMAPEVIKGKKPSPQSDIFALGVLGYEMLTGQEPFASEHQLGYLFTNCQEEGLAPHHVVSSIPRELSMAVMRCLEKEPARRYHTAQHVIDDLDRCRSIIQTGTSDIVPRGADSALARDYDLAPKESETKKRPGTSRLAYAAFFLALAAAVITLAANVDMIRERIRTAPVGTENDLDTTRDIAETPTPPDSDSPPDEAEDGFEEQFRRLMTRWERRYEPAGEYRQAIDDFTALADTLPPGERRAGALDQAAAIYVSWAEHLQRNGEFEQARERYLHARNIAPEGSTYEEIYDERLPENLLAAATAAFREDRYAEAEEIVAELSERFPDSEAARDGARMLPSVMLAGAQQKLDTDEPAAALGILRKLQETFPETEQAQEAGRLLPLLHLNLVRNAIESEDIALLDRHAAILEEDYPGSEASEQLRELGPVIALARFRALWKAGDTEGADRALEKLISSFPDSPRVYEAARMRAGLEPEEGEELLPPRAAAAMLSDAVDAMRARRFAEAKGRLEDVVRRTPADSAEGLEALWLIPECIYKEAVRAYGTGEADRFPEALQRAEESFPFSEWGRTARTTLDEYEQTPEGMAYVPAGDFIMGADREDIVDRLSPFYPAAIIESEEELNLFFRLEGYASEMPAHEASTDSFYIDINPVTKSDYSAFIRETEHPAPEHWVDNEPPEGRGELPVTNVDYSDAQAYALWAGKRLPTEIEWEKAARGVDGRLYPWGNEFDEGRAHHLQRPLAGPLPVGSFPDGKSPYGLLDMIGNACEWTASRFLAYEGNEMGDHRAPYSEEFMVLRSGAWDADDTRDVPTTVTRRFPREPDDAARFIGFRCVKEIE